MFEQEFLEELNKDYILLLQLEKFLVMKEKLYYIQYIVLNVLIVLIVLIA